MRLPVPWIRILCLAAPLLAQATPPAKEDSGWVSLSNGANLDGFYAYFQDEGVVELAKQDAFVVEGGLIHVPKAHAGGYTNKEGHLITLKEYSWYRVRLDYRFSTDMSSQNAGLVIHIDNRAALVGKIKTLRPRSIEINMRRLESSQWTLWSATNLGPYISTTVKPGTTDFQAKADGGVDWTNDPWGSRIIRTTLPQSEKPMGEWNHGEALVLGDSMLVCTLNGRLRTQGWNFRLRGSPNDPDPAKRVPCERGGIGVQSEGQEIWYRNYEIMELEPHTMKPLNAKPTALAVPQTVRAPSRQVHGHQHAGYYGRPRTHGKGVRGIVRARGPEVELRGAYSFAPLQHGRSRTGLS
jgi:hypothetical protein